MTIGNDRVPSQAVEYECVGCGELKPCADFPDDPSVPGLCAECDLTQRPEDEPMEACHLRALDAKEGGCKSR